MKSAIYHGIKQISIEEKPMPKPGLNDVIVQIKRAGICATDVTAYNYNGDIVSIFPGAEFGHEMVGVVSEVGASVQDIFVGMRVFVNPLTFRNPTDTDRGGAFSEYVLVANAQLNYNLFVLPDNVSYDDAVVIEPFSVGVHGKNVPGAKPGSNIVIYGAGAIGLCTLSALVGSGVNNAVIVDLDDQRLALAKEMGGVPFNLKESNFREFLIGHFGQSDNCVGLPTPNVDIYIDCAGASNIPDQFLSMAKAGAKLSVVAVHKKSPEVAFSSLMMTEAVIMGSFMYTPKDINETLGYLSSHSTQINKIITHRYPHSQITEAFEMACDASQAIKVVIDYDL
ncbi:2-desacetyl-2-hydroxyethyl bacteriochlorophyllide A dehydrogenase [Fontibacillus panacisegetis]|uniref:2-desacetyl-2-hydroxyethyl bacteriochlorophyllide A dehydrogenase n=1 Tax=Fontibacillus panacisegetis TaxID=670482 RepID=A0A1G7IV00_9BACL|nr:alcohol dehydrogenase catalytic domain-containing protein [Fontibacillus panacisegetis]SDF16511.1 2-desacetyl-2-hydroxyethyl bacteriochlorophyllide A dehydrogenase [Fontibacillus panacisegetis]